MVVERLRFAVVKGMLLQVIMCIFLLAEVATLTRLASVDHKTGLFRLWLVTRPAIHSVLNPGRRVVTDGAGVDV